MHFSATLVDPSWTYGVYCYDMLKRGNEREHKGQGRLQQDKTGLYSKRSIKIERKVQVQVCSRDPIHSDSIHFRRMEDCLLWIKQSCIGFTWFAAHIRYKQQRIKHPSERVNRPFVYNLHGPDWQKFILNTTCYHHGMVFLPTFSTWLAVRTLLWGARFCFL